MTMKRVLSLVLLCVSLSAISAKGPVKGIPKACQVFKPFYSSIKNTSGALDYYSQNGFGQKVETTLSYWDAYSDRKDNKTFLNSDNTKPFSSLAFLEKVRIARIKNGFALVYSIPEDEDSVYPDIPSGVEWKGWLPMSNLIYYDKAIVDDNGVEVHLAFKDSMDFASKKLFLTARRYDVPRIDQQFTTLPDKANTLYYLIKEENSFYLLSTDPVIDEKSIYGWVSSRDMIMWSSRLALEPTWDPHDREFFSDHGIKISVLDDMNDPIGEVDLPYQQSVNFDPDRYRMRGGEWRFPLIYKTPSDSIYLCAISGRSKFLFEPSRKIQVTPEQDSRAGTMARINIYLVVDGSRLYEPFFPIIADRVKALENDGSSVRVGITIYHDSRNSKFMTESFPLSSPGNESLYNFIDTGGEYGFKDNLSEAPLLSTLRSCAYDAGFEEEDNNIVVVIGGRGDNSDLEESMEELAGLFARKNIHLYALQVQNNPLTAGYRLFGYQLESLIRSVVSSRLSENVYSYSSPESEEGVHRTYFMPLKQDSNVYESMNMIDNGLMSESEFMTELDMLFSRIGESVSDVSSLSAMYPDFFRYCYLKTSTSSRKSFKEVALFSQSDFDYLLGILKELNDVYLTGSNDRELFIKVLMESINSAAALTERNVFLYMFDSTKKRDLIKELGYRRVFALAEGLPWDNSFEGRTLKDIANPKVVLPEEYNYILSSISEHYYRLLEIRYSPLIYQSIINGSPFYWIPREDLL